MTNARPSDPDPAQSPDVDSGGSPTGPQTPDSDSTSLQSDSAAIGQSPTPMPGRKGPVLWIVVTVIFVLLVVVGLVGYMFEIL